MGKPNAEPLPGYKPRYCKVDAETEAELRQAMEEFERGEYIQLTLEQLDYWCETGDFPWLDNDESPG